MKPGAPKISNPKFQIPNKLQFPNSNNQTDFIWNLGDWDLFGVWCLGFGAFPRYALRGALLY